MKQKIIAWQLKKKAIKVSMALHLIFEKATNPSETTIPPVVLPSEQLEVYADTNICDIMNMLKRQLHNRIELYEGCGSAWVLSELVELDTTIWQLDPLRASSTFLVLPYWIRRKVSVINVQNKDLACFKWAVLDKNIIKR